MPKYKLIPEDKRQRKKWHPSKIAKAIKLVREKKIEYLKAAKQFNFPKTTLFRLAKLNELENVGGI